MNLKITALVIIVLLPISALFAQTKKIAHRSHSGKNTAITASMPGNLGWFPELERRDSIRQEKLKADSTHQKQAKDSTKKITPKKKDSAKKTDTAYRGALPVNEVPAQQATLLPALPRTPQNNTHGVWWMGFIVLTGAFAIITPLLLKKKS